MQAIAALANQAGAPLSIETVQLEGPKEGEVLIEVKASVFAVRMNLPDPILRRSGGYFPGHEGAGDVVDTGPGVTSLRPVGEDARRQNGRGQASLHQDLSALSVNKLHCVGIVTIIAQYFPFSFVRTME